MHTTTSDITLRDRIGGRWAVSAPVYWIMVAIVAVTMLFLEGGGDRTWGVEGAALVVSVVFAVASALVLWVADRTAFRNRRTNPVPIWAVAALGALFAVLRLALIAWIGEPLGRAGAEHLGVRVVAALVGGAFLYPLVVMLVDTLDRSRTEQRALLDRLADMRELQAGREVLIESITDRVYAEVLIATADARAELATAPDTMTADERLRVAERLRATVVDSLRPLSHRLYSAPAIPVPDVSPVAALRGALRRPALYPRASAIAVAVFSVPLATTQSKYLWGVLLIAASYGVAVLVPLALTTWLARSRAWVAYRALPLAVIGAAVFMMVRVGIVQAVSGNFVPGRIAVAAGFTVFFVLMVSLVGAVIQGERDVTDELARAVDERAVDAAVANRELARVSRDIAQHVHGTLQSQLLATAFAVERATADGDDEGAATAIEQARRALDADPAPRSPATSVAAEVEARVSLWHGFMPIDVSVDPRIGFVDPGVVADIGRVVEEGLGNAHKHGGAVGVRVIVERHDDAVRVRVLDDGPGPADGVHGMGFAWLDFFAPGAWSLTPAGPRGGAELCVDLPAGTPAPADHRPGQGMVGA